MLVAQIPVTLRDLENGIRIRHIGLFRLHGCFNDILAQCEGDFDVLAILVAVHAQFDLCRLAIIVVAKRNCGHLGSINVHNGIGTFKLYSELYAIAFQQGLLLFFCQISTPFPTGKMVVSAHSLYLVIAIRIGIVDSDLVLLAITEYKGDLHCEVTLLQTAVCVFAGGEVLHRHRYFRVGAGVGHYGSAVFLLVYNDDAAIVLVAQIPVTLRDLEVLVSQN